MMTGEIIFHLLRKFAALFLAFTVGVVVIFYQLPPYDTLRVTNSHLQFVWSWVDLQIGAALGRNPHLVVMPAGIDTPPAPRRDLARAQPGLTLAEAYDGSEFGLVLVDLEGKPVHRWHVPQAVYDQVRSSDPLPIERGLQGIMGSYLYPDGDVLIVMSYKGLMRLDRCSRLKWFVPDSIHHDVEVDPDGSLWTLGLDIVKDAEDAPPRVEAPFLSGKVMHLSPDGAVLEEIPLMRAIFDGGYLGVVLGGSPSYPQTTDVDPMHSNNINIVSKELAPRFPFASAGDILVSLRSVDSLILIDRKTHKVKWALRGPFLRQHDPDLHPDGSISVLDNRADDAQHNETRWLRDPQTFGYSRIVRLDPMTQKVIWQYQGTEKEPFYTSVQGEHQFQPNGDVLVTEAESGRIFEVDPHDNSIVWEWYNAVVTADGHHAVGRVVRAYRYPPGSLTFLGQPCPAQ